MSSSSNYFLQGHPKMPSLVPKFPAFSLCFQICDFNFPMHFCNTMTTFNFKPSMSEGFFLFLFSSMSLGLFKFSTSLFFPCLELLFTIPPWSGNPDVLTKGQESTHLLGFLVIAHCCLGLCIVEVECVVIVEVALL